MKKKTLTVATVILVLVGFTVGYWLLIRDTEPISSDANIQENTSDDSEYDPPTEEELEATENIKDEAINHDSDPLGVTVNPIISTWGTSDDGKSILINGFIPEIIESTGKCTLTIENSTFNFTQSKVRDGYPDAQSTICGPFEFNKSQVPDGSVMVLKYESPKYSGESEGITLEL